MNYNDKNFAMVAKTMAGFENILAHELNEIGAENIEIGSRAVSFLGNTSILYKSNYCCRTALHILKIIDKFHIDDENELYNKISNIKWENFMGAENSLSVDAVCSSSVFNNSHYLSLKTKDAVVDRFRNRYGKRPNVDIKEPDLKINIHILKNFCTVSIDSSGNSLHKRGYRIKTGTAPINEVLAAGIIILSDWDKKSDFIDPMCGSGTIVCEAAMIANQIPPGYYRKSFGFEKWKDFDAELWSKIKRDADEKITEFDFNIIGSDISTESIKIAMENAKSAKLHKDIIFEVKSIEDQLPPSGKGTMITNPPYGERIKPDDIIKLYQNIGDTLKKNYVNYNAWIISSDFRALKFIGLKPSKKISLFNGPLECKLLKFEIFEGSLKQKKIDNIQKP